MRYKHIHLACGYFYLALNRLAAQQGGKGAIW